MFRHSKLWAAVPAVLVLTFLSALQPSASAAVTTTVSLDFDGNTVSQYTLGYLQALQPHSAPATFYVSSGTVGASGNFMSWTQLSTLALAGNDIGGKSVNATNLTTDPNPTAQVCNDRAAIIQHGLVPVSFAYPGGATNATVKSIVKNCGYGNARTAGSLSPTGPTYAEPQPPTDWYGVRAYAPAHPTAATMEALVTGASTHGGGWTNIVIGKICSQASDPSNYATCSASSGSMELSELNSFLDWMKTSAPVNTSLATASGAVNPIDTGAPTSSITCNGTACQASPYTGIVSIALSATDIGSGVASIHYTTDGTTPTLNSPTYSGPFNVNGASQSTTVSYAAWDYAGNAEAAHSQVVLAPPDTSAPTTAISCNATSCSTSPYVATVTVTLTASDTGGSGTAGTFYTTDGSVPTASNPYTGPVTINTPGTYDVKFYSVDNAGNAEAVQTQQVKVVPVTSRVLLTFDNGNVSQFNLGYQQALQPHNASATFFVNTATIGASGNSMTWNQLATLNSAGDDIGGKTNSTNLTTDPNPTAQVCNDRKNLVQHGLDPEAFAYPGGAFNAGLESIVKNCGYGIARTAGSLSPTGPTYAESVPPKDWYATRAYAPGGQISVSSMENLVTGAAGHGGGWSQIVIGRVCSQAQDPGNYSACTATAGWIELADLNTFLDWMANAGQSGGAPAGAMLSTVRAAAISADSTPPVTTATCGDAACPTGTQTTTTYVTLSATDVGSGLASTHYTTDGSAPTLTSPTYSAPIPVTQTTTITYASWDNAGNAESPRTVVITADLPADTTAPTTVIQCDGAPCQLGPDGGYNGKTTVTLVASDGTGWGVDKTYYTTDGSAPTVSSAIYSGPITLSTPGTYTVQAFSVDLAGNSESVQTQSITVLAPKVVVSLTFDDGVDNQYSLGYLRALKPHHLHGTFYDVSGLNGVDPQHMTWDQLRAVNNGGNEIGGHTVDHVNLKLLTDTNKIQQEVCQDRQNLINQGFDPVSFAYPEGAYNATDESIVQGCGYSTARAAGGIDVAGDGAGPVYAETLPPLDPFATRTGYDPPSGTPLNVPPISLAHLESQVTGAAQHGGGWITVVLHQVCSQTLDPANYSSCIADWGPIELDTLNAFLDWLQNSGNPGGAPARTAVETVRQVMVGPDTQAPVSTLDCDGTACGATTYTGSTLVSFNAHDPGGSGIAATYYTTDGSDPTTNSPVFTKPFTINSSTTFKFFSVDNSGNVEPIQTLPVNVVPNADPVVGAAGDIACDPDQIAFNDGLGTDTDCRAIHTVGLLHGVDAVLPLGDDQYWCGGTQAFAQSYDQSWGMVKSITHPVPGDQDYNTTGGTDCPAVAGAGYFQYFGAAAGDPSKGYYSYNLGQWHVIALNTAPCGDDPTTCQAGSAQDQWLKQDLAANTSACTLAYYQNPRWVSTAGGGSTTYQPLWQDLYDGGADVVLNGDSHWYERFAPQNGAGQLDTAHGVREFVVGTGGQGLDTPAAPARNSQVLDASTHGVIRLTLHANSYNWSFVPDEGTFTDSGTDTCHSAADAVPPTTTISCNSGTCGTGFSTTAVQVGLAAVDNPSGSGVDKTYYTTDGSTPTTASNAYTAPFQVAATTTVKYFSTDKNGNAEPVQSQQINVDLTAPTTTASCNGAACSSGWYGAPVQFALTAADPNGSGVATTYYTTDGSTPTTASAVYSTPITVSSTTTVKYFSVDTSGNAEPVQTQQVRIDTAAPTTAASCSGSACNSTWYTSPVQLTLAATDTGGSGVTNTYYTTDGSTPTTGSAVYNNAITLSTQTAVKYFSVDAAGNAEPVQTQTVKVDTTAPVTTAACNAAGCSTGWYNASVRLTLAATDTGGSGVATTYYTTNGSDPTTSSAIYSSALTIASTTTVKYFSVDAAGNAAPVATTAVRIDTAAPTSSIACNGAACSSAAYSGTVTVTLAGTDTGGSGVAAVRYTTNGTTPTTASPAYTAPLSIAATTTIRYRAWDAAGNVEATTHSTTVTIRDNPPAVSFTLTPSTGIAPFTVSADASASTDTDNSPIRNYRFAWGDGTVAVTQTGATATHNYTRTGTFTVTVTVTDTAGLSSSATKTVVSKANLATNNGFESNVNGWASGTSGVTVSRVNGGHSGNFAAALTNNGLSTTSATLTDSPAFVRTTSAGTYVATLWVKGAAAGGTLQLALTELDSRGTVLGSASTPIRLTTSWQQVSVSYTTKRPGASSLDLTAVLPSVPGRTIGFYADDATLTL